MALDFGTLIKIFPNTQQTIDDIKNTTYDGKVAPKQGEAADCVTTDELQAFKKYLDNKQDKSLKELLESSKVNEMLNNFEKIDQYGAQNLHGTAGDGYISGNEYDAWKKTQPINIPA